MADVSGIIGNPPKQVDPLAIISGWQDYANKVAQNSQIKAATANTQQSTLTSQQELQQKMAERHAQLAQQYANMSDQQLQGGAPLYEGLNQELASGQINQKSYDVMKSQLDQANQQGGGNGAAFRPLITQLLKTNLTAPQLIGASQPQVHDTDIGGQLVPRTIPSPLDLMQNPNLGVFTSPGAINRTQAPGYEGAGDRLVPVGGANGAPGITLGTSPDQANAVTTLTDPVSGLPVTGRNYQQGGLVQSSVGGQPSAGSAASGVPQGGGPSQPPQGGFRLPGAGVQQAVAGGPMGTGGPPPAPGGLLGKGPVVNNPQAIQAQGDNYKNFRESLDAQPLLKTNEQTLIRANQALQTIPTGPGTDKLQMYRNYVSSLNAALGGKITSNDIAAGGYDELNKDFSQLVAQAGQGAHYAGNVDAIIHGNPNMLLNRLANSNVTALLVGQNRQKQLEVKMTQDQNSGRDFQQARQKATDLDPRALALDAMSPTMRQQTLNELKDNPAAYDKFYRTIAVAHKFGVFNTGPGQAPARDPAASLPSTPNNLNTAPGLAQ